jgi:hypothetical protein
MACNSHGTSFDTSNDISYDTSYNTSYGTSVLSVVSPLIVDSLQISSVSENHSGK